MKEQNGERYSTNDEIYHFNHEGKFQKTEKFIAPVCPTCRRYEHKFEFANYVIWCCSQEDCMEQRLLNAGAQSNLYPVNYIGHLKKKNNFCNAVINPEKDIDFYEKWQALKQSRIKDIFYHGEVGLGKTACMYAALRDVCRLSQQSTACILTEAEMYEKIKNTWHSNSKISEEAMVKKFSSVDFLFLDDLGAATRTIQGEWGKQILLDILDERLNSLSHMTIVSTNYSVEDIGKTYNPRIADRLRLMTDTFIQGKSRRIPFKSTETGQNQTIFQSPSNEPPDDENANLGPVRAN